MGRLKGGISMNKYEREREQKYYREGGSYLTHSLKLPKGGSMLEVI